MKSTEMIKSRWHGDESYRLVRYLCLTLLILVMLAAVFVLPAGATKEGGNIPVSIENGATSPSTAILLRHDQQNPVIIALADKNKWFVVWEDWRNWSTSGVDIYGRFINGDGSYCGNEIAISTASGNQTVPTAAYRDAHSGNDNIIVAWQDSRGSALSGYIYYRVCNISSLASNCSSGFTLGSERALSYQSIGGDHLNSRKLPKLAYDRVRDQFWLVWVESRDHLQRVVEYPFGPYGVPEWHFGDSNYIAYTTISAGAYTAAVPEILRNKNGTTGRTVRLLSSSSKVNGTKTTATYNYEYFTDINNVTVACDDSAPETLIAWEGTRGTATLTCNWEENDEKTIEVCHDECDDADPPVCEEVCEDYPNPDYGQPTVNDSYDSTFEITTEDGGAVHIYSIFDKYIGQPVVGALKVDASDKPSYYPSLGYDSIHRKFLVAWEDRGTGIGGDGVHSNIAGQLIYSGGGVYGANFAVSYQDLDGDGGWDDELKSTNQTRPHIAADTSNQRFFVTWQDGRNGEVSAENLDIYGQFVDSEGSLRGNNYAVCIAQANQQNPVTAFNQSNHQLMTVWKDARNLNTTNSDIYAQRLSLGQPQLVLLNADGSPLTPSLIDYGLVEEGMVSTVPITVKNIGDTTVKLDAVTPLLKPFYYLNLPAELAEVDDKTIDLMPGSSFVLKIIFTPDVHGVFFDKFTTVSNSTDLTVRLQGQSLEKEVYLAPSILAFPAVELGKSAVMNIIITNNSDQDVQVKGSMTGRSVFSVKGFDPGTVISSGGGSLVGQVTFKPTASGYVDAMLNVSLGPVQDMAKIPAEEIDWGISYGVILTGIANADFALSERNTFTADVTYNVNASASTANAGQLYVLFSHDPLSYGNIYALTKDGSLVPFPYQAVSDWQNLWYLNGASPGLKLDLSKVDFRALGCTQCQGPGAETGGGGEFHFGEVVITPKDDGDFNNATDFKYMSGTLYIATYVKDASISGAFDFNSDLIEMQMLHINSLAGTWQVTSSYYGEDRVHSSKLVVTESGDGNISAVWPGYNVNMSYGAGEYVMTFSMGAYNYTYKITSLTADKFSGTYSCIANGENVVVDAPMSGIRLK
jgi:hypothetical protein